MFLEKNPGLSTLAVDDDWIVGTALGAFDGRKGYVQKVAVKSSYRGKGLGQVLVKETIKKLRKVGALDVRVGCDKDLVSFYEQCGFKVDGIIPMKIKEY